MKLLPVRFSLRRMMLGVAVLSLVLAVVAHDQRLRYLAANHRSKAFQLFKTIPVVGAGPVGTIGLGVSGQPGTFKYQSTRDGLKQMKIADRYARQAKNLEKTFAVVVLISIAWGLVEVLAARRRNQGALDA